MTFKYSYEECLACSNLARITENNATHLIGICKVKGGITPYKPVTCQGCNAFKPKEEVKMEKFCETCKHLYSRENEEPCTNCKNNYLLKWEPIPLKKKITIYVYKSTIDNEIKAFNDKLNSEIWILIESIEREYEI